MLESSPKWKPGTTKGKPTPVKYTCPVDFRLDADGNVVSHANEDFLPKKEGNTALADVLGVDLSQASQIRDYDGKMKFIATAAVEVTGWTLGVVQDKAVVTDLIRQNVIQVVLIGLVLIVVVTLIMIGSVKKSLKPMENMKFFIWDKVIGRENCRKQKAMVCWYFWTERS